MIENNTELEPGSLFAKRYEVIRPIGSGAMGAVYLACDPRYRDFLVALKVIYPQLLKSQELRDWFRNEIIVAFGVHHRNIVQAYDYFDEDGLQAYAMEYIEGEDLFDYMGKGAVAINDGLNILKQVALALKAIHKKNILHRDLKPENILVQEDGLIKVADFGVAAVPTGIKEGPASEKFTKRLVGTPKYLAPEYIESYAANPQTDIYALGIIAYELFTGELAAPDGVTVDEIASLAVVRPTSINDFNGSAFPKDLVKLVDGLMAVDPGSRFKNMDEVIIGIEGMGV